MFDLNVSISQYNTFTIRSHLHCRKVTKGCQAVTCESEDETAETGIAGHFKQRFKTASQSNTDMNKNMSAERTKSLKRRRTQSNEREHHSISHVQHQPAQTEAAAQDEAFVQAQLMRSICSALAVVGYDSVRPSALEMFRSHVQECGWNENLI